MKKNELNQQYYSLLSDLDKTASKHKLSDEISNVVYISDWVKIYLVGNIKNKQVSIQVEVVFSSFNHSDKERRLNLVLENQIQYLKYLKYLYDNGFTLDIVKEEAIWSAIKILKTEPTDEITSIIFRFLNKKNEKLPDS